MIQSHIFLVAVVSILSIVSCSEKENIQNEDTDNKVNASCSIMYKGNDVDDLQIEAKASEVSLEILSNVSWTLSTDDCEWITLSSTAGAASGKPAAVLLNVDDNIQYVSRQAVITLKAGKASDKLTIIQKGADVADIGWETAEQAVAHMGVGWNLGNTMDCMDTSRGRPDDWLFWETFWGQSKTTPELMQMMKNAGFGVIRVPVTWGIHMDADGKVYDAWMNRVHEIVDYVLDTGMYCIVNVHHDTGAGDDKWLHASMDSYNAVKDKYIYLWQQIAEEFKDYGPRLLFESYNEMLDDRSSWCYASHNGEYDAEFAADAYEAINTYAQTFVDVMRSSGGNNSNRNLIVNTYGACSGEGSWSRYLQDPLKEMKLPVDVIDNHLIFEVHAYPMIDDMEGMKKSVRKMFDDVEQYLVAKGAPVIFGEWGTFSENPTDEARIEFLDFFVTEAKSRDIGTIYWMGLSDGTSRAFPAFNQPEFAEAIVKAYHGDSFMPFLPTIEDYDYSYITTYKSQWGELYIADKYVDMSEYKGIYLELEDDPDPDALKIKVYGVSGEEMYNDVTSAETVIYFDKEVLGGASEMITLQYMLDDTYTYSVRVKRSALIRKDGTKESIDVRPFWGCDIEIESTPLY